MKEIVVSGIRPTGHLHLGNYFGAVKNFISMQYDFNCFYFIADYHSLTTHPDTSELKNSVKWVLAEYLACGIDPEKSTLYVQSDIPQIHELYMLLNMHAYKGELERCASFKEKIRTQPENINAGLLTYPVLMASDILVHRGVKVPVGKDQEQHLEMARTFANRFNRIYNCELFPEPFAYNFGSELVKVPGLNGKGKMSKSENDMHAIFLCDDEETIRKKVMKAKTDAGPSIPDTPLTPEIQNLLDLMRLVSDNETAFIYEKQYYAASIRYGELKKHLANEINAFVAPVRKKIQEIISDDNYLKNIARKGAEKARESAELTMKTVRDILGLSNYMR